MKQFTMQLYQDLQRPTIPLPDWHNFDAMLDTGALFPVWIDDEELLIKTGAKLVKDEVIFGGIGGKVIGKLYQLPYFKLGELIYPNMHILCYPMENRTCHMLLSSTMFSGLRCEIDYENYKLNVTIPDGQQITRNLVIRDSNGKLHVACQSAG